MSWPRDMIGWKVSMSERSKKLARFIRRSRCPQPKTKRENQNELLDKGYGYLKIDVEREFHNQIDDVNQEPGCASSLGGAFVNGNSHVFKIGAEDKGLTIEFDPDKRALEIKGQGPIKFFYFIQVRLSQDGTTWGYAGRENNAELAPISCKLDAVVEKALFALFGIEA